MENQFGQWNKVFDSYGNVVSLPEFNVPVIIQHKDKEYMGQWLEIDHLVKGYGHGYWSTHGLDVTDGEIVAWMYAPTPVEF